MPVLVVDLAGRELLEGDREVVVAVGLDHRRRVLLVRALTERAVVAVQLPGSLRGDDDRRVMRVGLLHQLVYSRLDHRRAV